MVLSMFFIGCGLISIISLRLVRKQQSLKIKHNKGIFPCDIKFSNKNTIKLVIYSFIGGWVSGALGLGGGGIFNPILIGMGTPPAVATATSMYMISFSSAGSILTYFIYGLINIPSHMHFG